MPGEEKVWLRDKSLRAHRDRDDDDDQIKITIHTSANCDYDGKITNSQPNDRANYSNWSHDAGETLEMLDMTQTKRNNLNGRETNGHHVNNYSGTFTKTTSIESTESYDKL